MVAEPSYDPRQSNEMTDDRVPRSAMLAQQHAELTSRPWRQNTAGEDMIPEQSQPSPRLRGSVTGAAGPAPLATTPEPRATMGDIAEMAANTTIDMAVHASASPSLAKVAGAAAKSLISCARRATAVSPEEVASLVAYDVLEDTEATEEKQETPPKVPTNETLSTTVDDTAWRQGVHLRRSKTTGKSSLEECVSEWHKKRVDAHGRTTTMTAR